MAREEYEKAGFFSRSPGGITHPNPSQEEDFNPRGYLGQEHLLVRANAGRAGEWLGSPHGRAKVRAWEENRPITARPPLLYFVMSAVGFLYFDNYAASATRKVALKKCDKSKEVWLKKISITHFICKIIPHHRLHSSVKLLPLFFVFH